MELETELGVVNVCTIIILPRDRGDNMIYPGKVATRGLIICEAGDYHDC
jgi:hypothetical protein